jgi:redox-sensitive bicupin YhaK (pirin superfamily)
MIVWRPHHQRGHANHGWLDSWHSFSFADYYDPDHMGISDLRVINDDRIAPGGGFPLHPHRDMEIITYLLEGAVSHRDSMGNETTISQGEIQRMRAGTGVRHSEYNASSSEPLHLLQIWIVPEESGLTPDYAEMVLDQGAMTGALLPIVSRDGRDGSLTIAQDITIYATRLRPDDRIEVADNQRLRYLHLARGELLLNGEPMVAGDAATICDEPIILEGGSGEEAAEALLFDLRRERDAMA